VVQRTENGKRQKVTFALARSGKIDRKGGGAKKKDELKSFAIGRARPRQGREDGSAGEKSPAYNESINLAEKILCQGEVKEKQRPKQANVQKGELSPD